MDAGEINHRLEKIYKTGLAEFVMGRDCYGPSLLWAELSRTFPLPTMKNYFLTYILILRKQIFLADNRKDLNLYSI